MGGLRILFSLIAVVLLVAGGFVAYAWRAEIAPIEPEGRAAFDKALVTRGAELAAIGNCGICHTAPGGEAYAGGRAIATPFGAIHATNITPDRETGIGRWSEAAFQRSMREGVDRAGRHLYPAFPYDHFTLVSDDDNRALYAFLMSREPVSAKPPENELPFPLNIRMAIAGWKLLYFREGRYQPNNAKSAEWNRGAYLAEGLGHCGACHTPRNRLGAERSNAHFDGAEIEGWHAYAINARSPAPTAWTVDELAFYLRQGWHPQHGMARGPMVSVVENLAVVPEADVRAIATYVGEMTQQARPPGPKGSALVAGAPPRAALTSADTLVSPPSVAGQARSNRGALIYASACANCHEAGRPLPFGGVDLSLSSGITGPTAHNLINVTLYGLPASPGEPSAVMPGFHSSLTDGQLEALLIYLRSRFTDKPAWRDVRPMIRAARNPDTRPALYPVPGLQRTPANPSQTGVAW